MFQGYEPLHIVGISETAYGLTTPRCLDWQHESNRARADPGTKRLSAAQGNPGAACRTRLPGRLHHGGAEDIHLPVGTPPQATSPSGTVAPQAGTATPGQEQPGAISWCHGLSCSPDAAPAQLTPPPGPGRHAREPTCPRYSRPWAVSRFGPRARPPLSAAWTTSPLPALSPWCHAVYNHR